MAQREKLDVGETGFVAREQLWLSNDDPRLRLYVEPKFWSESQAVPGMLRMTAIASKANPGESYYGIYLPKQAMFGRLTQAVTVQRARAQGLIAVKRVLVINDTPGKSPFATVPDFYFPPA